MKKSNALIAITATLMFSWVSYIRLFQISSSEFYIKWNRKLITMALSATLILVYVAPTSAGICLPCPGGGGVPTQQVISFGPPPIVVVGGIGKIVATASSGLPVTFTSLTNSVCSISSGNIVSGLNVGTCTIVANQSGNTGWAAAPPVAKSFTVGRVCF